MTVNNILQSLPSNHLKDLSFVLKTTKTTLFVFIIRFFDKFLDVIIDNPLKKYFAIHINSNSHLNEMGKTPSKKIHMYKKISFHYIFISLEPSASAIVCICIMLHLCIMYVHQCYYMQCAVSALQPLCYSICSTKYTLVFTRPLVERTNGKDMCLRL